MRNPGLPDFVNFGNLVSVNGFHLGVYLCVIYPVFFVSATTKEGVFYTLAIVCFVAERS